MYTLPTATRITIRDITNSLRRLVTSMYSRWQHDRISVLLGESITVEDAVGFGGGLHLAVMLNLVSGTMETPQPSVLRNSPYRKMGYSGTLEPGIALVTFRRRTDYWKAEYRDLDVMFYIGKFTNNNDTQAALDVARDAILAGDNDDEANRIASHAADHTHVSDSRGGGSYRGWPLWVALCKKERAALQAAEKNRG